MTDADLLFRHFRLAHETHVLAAGYFQRVKSKPKSHKTCGVAGPAVFVEECL